MKREYKIVARSTGNVGGVWYYPMCRSVWWPFWYRIGRAKVCMEDAVNACKLHAHPTVKYLGWMG